MSHVTCHMSHVMFHKSSFFLLLFFVHSSEAYWWRVCFQWGLPRLVFEVLISFVNPIFSQLQRMVNPVMTLDEEESRTSPSVLIFTVEVSLQRSMPLPFHKLRSAQG